MALVLKPVKVALNLDQRNCGRMHLVAHAPHDDSQLVAVVAQRPQFVPRLVAEFDQLGSSDPRWACSSSMRDEQPAEHADRERHVEAEHPIERPEATLHVRSQRVHVRPQRVHVRTQNGQALVANPFASASACSVQRIDRRLLSLLRLSCVSCAKMSTSANSTSFRRRAIWSAIAMSRTLVMLRRPLWLCAPSSDSRPGAGGVSSGLGPAGVSKPREIPFDTSAPLLERQVGEDGPIA
jgi:hypothetical protein